MVGSIGQTRDRNNGVDCSISQDDIWASKGEDMDYIDKVVSSSFKRISIDDRT